MQKKVTIYTARTCPWCARAKSMLTAQNIGYEEIIYEFDTPEMDALIERTQHETVPQIFFGEKFIGGSDELAEIVTGGQIKSLLE